MRPGRNCSALAPPGILIDQSEELPTDDLRAPHWVPSLAYSVGHPVFGTAILDAGLRSGDGADGLRPVYWAPCRNTPGSDLVSQLKRDGVESDEIAYIIPSHFDGDHISGLESLLAFVDAPLLMTGVAMEEVRNPFCFVAGIPSDMLKADMCVQLLDGRWLDDPALGESVDVFGDGALRLFATPGHTEGHMSALQ